MRVCHAHAWTIIGGQLLGAAQTLSEFCLVNVRTHVCGSRHPTADLRQRIFPSSAGYKTRSWSWSWSFTRSRTSTAPFYRTPPLIGCLDTATAPDIDLGVQLPAFDILFVLF